MEGDRTSSIDSGGLVLIESNCGSYAWFLQNTFMNRIISYVIGIGKFNVTLFGISHHYILILTYFGILLLNALWCIFFLKKITLMQVLE